MIATYIQKGDVLEFKNTTDEMIPLGTIIKLSGVIGVAADDIYPGMVGSVAVRGVWQIFKTGKAAITQGQKLYFDGEGVTDAAGDTFAGFAFADADANAESALVKLSW